MAAPDPTEAATVSVIQVPDPDIDAYYNVLTYRAAPGERNQVRLVASREPAGFRQDRLLVSDATAPLMAGSGCASVDAHTADCLALAAPNSRLSLTLDADVRLGDGDDLAEAVVGGFQAGGKFDFRGEEGNDRLLIPAYQYFYGDLRGGPGDDVVHGLGYGGGPPQLLDGGPGADEIVGGRGSDMLRDGDPDRALAPDSIDGGRGRGRDTLDYRARVRPLRVDLAAGRGGEAGEGDRLAGLEEVLGGEGDDVLRGGPGGEALDGGGGIDFVSGRGGDDTLFVRDGERAAGGLGNDEVRVSGIASIACGAGPSDEVEEVDRPAAGPRLARDCEIVGNDPGPTDTPSGLFVDPRARVSRAGVIRLRVRCGGCDSGRINVTGTGRPFRVLARGLFRLRLPPGTDFGEDYAMGSGVVPLPAPVARRLGRGATRLRFVLRSGAQRVVWTIGVRTP